MWKYVKKYLPVMIIAALFMILEVLMDLIQPSLMSTIVDDGVLGLNNEGAGSMQIILKLGILMIIVAVAGGFFGSMNNVFSHFSCQNIVNNMRKDCFRNIMNFSFPQIDNFSTGSLITRITNDTTQVQNFLAAFIRGMTRTFMLGGGSLVFLFILNRQFGFIVLCSCPFMISVMIFCMHRANPLFEKLQKKLDQVNAIMQEDISGIRVIKACVRELYEKIRFSKANDELIGTQLSVLVIFAFMNPVMNIFMYAAVAIILYVGSFEVSSGSATPGMIMAAITYTTQMLNGILMLVMLFQNLSRGIVSWRRIKKILNTEPELKDGIGRESKKMAERNAAKEPFASTSAHGLGAEVIFKNASFSYPGQSEKVLKNINITINPGETVAIMGATGCGKTTLINLIPRFYDVTDGAVLIDGIDVRDYKLHDLREKVAVVLQKSELFNDTAANNISWGKEGATPKEICSAAKISQADEFICLMKDGYDSMIAERGMSLSGGQKQRISIARAVLKDAPIMILDDSTSALDLATEASLFDALDKTNSHSTRILVAQRIASAKRADRIIILERGTILDCGSHEELLKRCRTYRDIYDSQIKEVPYAC